MKRITTSLITLAAMLFLTVGALFATPQSDCCKGGDCCQSVCACCQNGCSCCHHNK